MWREDGALVPFRLIFAVQHEPGPKLCMLGLMPREDDYDESSDFGQRVRSQYEHFGVRHISRA
jgi:hypothetical protein